MLQEVAQEIKNTIVEMLREVHTAMPGKIIKYDPEKCEAEILPYGKLKLPNGRFINYPQLNHIPILFLQSSGQDCCIVYPVNPGDECLVLIQEQTLDMWRSAGAQTDNNLRFDLTNAVAIMGMFAKPQPLAKEAQDGNKLIIQKGEHRLYITPDEIALQYGTDVRMGLNANGIMVDGGMVVTGDLVVTGDTAVNGSLQITGTGKIDGTLDISKNITVGGRLHVGESVTLEGNISVGGDAEIAGTLMLGGVNMNTHTHGGVTEGWGKTLMPQ